MRAIQMVPQGGYVFGDKVGRGEPHHFIVINNIRLPRKFRYSIQVVDGEGYAIDVDSEFNHFESYLEALEAGKKYLIAFYELKGLK